MARSIRTSTRKSAGRVASCWAEKTKTLSQDQADSFRERLAKVKALKVFSNQSAIELGTAVQTLNIQLAGERRVICEIGDAFGKADSLGSIDQMPIMVFSKVHWVCLHLT